MLQQIVDSVSVESVYVIRILIASFCGGLIGYERSQRQKDAGIRTHIIV